MSPGSMEASWRSVQSSMRNLSEKSLHVGRGLGELREDSDPKGAVGARPEGHFQEPMVLWGQV